MQLIDGKPVYAATDLVGFLACEHLTNLELSVLAGIAERPIRADPELDRIRIRGEQHEQRYLADLVAAGRRVTSLKIPDEAWKLDRGTMLRGAAEETRQAILRGDDVIYQASFFDGTWLGFADFLLRVEQPTPALGWSYEVVDTKLARHTKASAVLQICSYIDQLTPIQGAPPTFMRVALGGSARTVDCLRVADYMAYYRTVKHLFLEATGRPLPTVYPPPDTYPDPVEHCDVCRWAIVCQQRRRADDDLSLVAGIAKVTRKELKGRDIGTRRGLAVLDLPLTQKLDRTKPETLKKAHEQAAIQVRGDDEGRPLYQLLPPIRTDSGELDTTKGLLALPEPRPGDLFLDLEGDPFALDDGVDYLFGILEPGRQDPDGQPLFHAFWSRDDDGRVTADAEKRAFEQCVDFIQERLNADPSIHVYHYAAYEHTAFGRLMGRYRTREVEIDRLFRGDILVDLYRLVKQGLIASVESYSIKKLEPQYGYTREVDLRDAGSSIVAFETWLEVGGESGNDDETLVRIERYNRDDVVSTWLLRDWLEARRTEMAAQNAIAHPPRPGPGEPGEDEKLADWLARVKAVADPLTADVPADPESRTPVHTARQLLADLLGWHRREAKASWWRYFYLRDDITDEDRVDEDEPIGMLERVQTLDEEKRIYRYRFPPQEYDVSPGRDATDPDPDGEGNWKVSVVALDGENRTVDLRHRRNRDVHHPRSLVPDLVYDTRKQEESLLRIGSWVATNGIEGPGEYRAARDMLLRQRPRVGLRDGTPLRIPWQNATTAARDLALALDQTCLPIQGPPGSGKTYIGARMILDLVVKGKKRVGVTANSHKVIGNLLDAVEAAAREEGCTVRIGQKGDEGGPTCGVAVNLKDNKDIIAAFGNGTVDVVGATAWAWAREDFAGLVDVLVVDEAGQFALANAIAVSPAASSLILLGDPQQLDQPTQGTHPPGAERSALAHILAGKSTMPEDRGLFLERTWRLHPDICSFTSEAFYTSQLQPEPGNELQALRGAGVLDGTGIRWLAVDHVGNVRDSPEEAGAIARIVTEVLRAEATWTDRDGLVAGVGPSQVLITTPYNDHRELIEGALRAAGIRDSRVGTVDKFQGQEAPISIYSMGTSTPEEAPRGLDFLYSLNRLNVATSRARCLTVLVCSPELLRVRCSTPEQMKLVNALCRLVEIANSPS